MLSAAMIEAIFLGRFLGTHSIRIRIQKYEVRAIQPSSFQRHIMNNSIPCTIKVLPPELHIPAAKRAIEINPQNAPAMDQLRMAAPDAIIEPAHLALLTAKYWGIGGVHLTVGFLDNPAADLKAKILSHMNAWGAGATSGLSKVR
jgi:hypothetical protein